MVNKFLSMMKNNVAILITTYNGGQYVFSLLEKIRYSLIVAGVKYPIYIYDDYSTDNTIALIEDYKKYHPDEEIIEFVNVVNLGLFPNKNHALKKLRNSFDWVFIMHQDDYPNENWILNLNKVISNYDTNNVFVLWSNYLDSSFEIVNLDTDNLMVERIIANNENVEFWSTEIYTSFSISGSAINLKFFDGTRNIFDEKFRHFGDTCFIVDNMSRGLDHLFIQNNLITRRTSLKQASNIHFQNSTDIEEFIVYFRSRSHIIVGKKKFIIKLLMLIIRRILVFIKRGDVENALINYSHFKSLFRDGFLVNQK